MLESEYAVDATDRKNNLRVGKQHIFIFVELFLFKKIQNLDIKNIGVVL